MGDDAALIAAYQPHYIIKCDAENCDVTVFNDTPYDIAPDLALLLSTSGSTGSKKFVKISAAAIQHNTTAINAYLENTQKDRAITSLKLHYSYGLSVLNTILDVGGSIVLNNSGAFTAAFWEALNSYNVTCFSGVPHHFTTFEKLGLKWADYKGLRYVTQAGGKLSAALIKKQAKQCAESDIKFFVMYGQTEAAPRISYVPPTDVQDNADCIGRAINGGALHLLDDAGEVIADEGVAGELVYTGENIMSGYALSYADLGMLEDIKTLRTGDLALRNGAGYYKIVGRKSRFVKPLGVRINLDDIERHLHVQHNDVYVVGNDRTILIAHTHDADRQIDLGALAQKYNLPVAFFMCKALQSVPLLENGKTDYKELEKNISADKSKLARIIRFVKSFCIYVFCDFFAILCGMSNQWDSVEAVFKENFPRKEITLADSFQSLGGDSLRYVGTSLGLESLLGALPQNWHELSIAELENMRQAAHV